MTAALEEPPVEPDDLEEDDLEGVEDDDEGEELDESIGHVEASFSAGDHPRAPAGSSTGGEFAPSGDGGGSKKPKPKPKGKPAARRSVPKGSLGFDGQHGTGYDHPADTVKALQGELNRLGVTDAGHAKLAVDGKFGPRTTQSVKAAQQALGMQPTGVVTPAFVDRLKTLKSLPKSAKKTMAAALADIELVRPGTWQLASGEQTFTVEMLQDAARYAQKYVGARSALKLGHVDPRFDGEPAFGWLNNADIFLDEDERGPVLKARQLDGMPDWLAAAAPDAWPNRSVEGWVNFADEDGETYSFVIDGLALLGVTPPGISSIRSLRDLPAALGIAASAPARRVIARAPTAALVAATAPASEAEEPIKKGAGMDPAKIREACGLPADASDDEVKSTLAAAGFVPAAPEPVAAASKDAPGTMRVDASAWQEREERLARLEREAQRHRDGERDQIIASAVKDGKFAPSRKVHWSRLWDADPEGTREVIAGLAKGVMPTTELGYAEGETEADEIYAALYGKQKVG